MDSVVFRILIVVSHLITSSKIPHHIVGWPPALYLSMSLAPWGSDALNAPLNALNLEGWVLDSGEEFAHFAGEDLSCLLSCPFSGHGKGAKKMS